MERGAGRYWTEDEIRALISVWSEKTIRKQLQGTLRNKGLFMYIAKRMQQLGVFRDWKQCRAKYKNLKYEYRAMNCGHSSGDTNKLRFYDELHAILGSETSTKQEAASDVTAMEEAMLGHQKNGGANDSLVIPPVCNEGGKHWTDRETRALINIWSDKNIRGQLKGTVRNQRIFEHIARLLQQAGIDRDWRQCRTKYKNLKHEYVVLKNTRESGNKSKTMKYFHELDAILSSKPAGHRKGHTDKQLPMLSIGSATSEAPANCPVDKLTRISQREKIQVETKQCLISAPPRLATVTEGGKHWTTGEIKALLTVWSDRNIRKSLSGTVRNRKIFEHIASLLQKLGVDRDWRQCRTKYKNLKHEYIVTKKALESGCMTRTMKFFNVLDEILQNKDSDLNQPDIVEIEASIPETHHRNGLLLTDHLPKCPKNTLDQKAPNIKQEPSFQGHRFDSEGNEQDLSSRGNLIMTIGKEETSYAGTELEDEADKDFRIVTVDDPGGGRNWSDHEVRSLLHVWSEKRISRQLDGTFRNKELFEEISHKLLEHGINRDWKQCRTKYKNLKYEYYSIKKDESLQPALRKKMKFFEEIDHLIRLPNVSELTAENPPPEGTLSRTISVQEPATITIQQDVIAEDGMAEMNKSQVHVTGVKRKDSLNEPNTPDKRKPPVIQIPDKDTSSHVSFSKTDANEDAGSLASPDYEYRGVSIESPLLVLAEEHNQVIIHH